MLNNSSILITGGTGSFGNVAIPLFLKLKFKEIRIISRDEMKQWNMSLIYQKHKNIKFFIGDIRDVSSLDRVFKNADYVMKNGILIGCHQGLKNKEINYIHSIIIKFLKSKSV